MSSQGSTALPLPRKRGRTQNVVKMDIQNAVPLKESLRLGFATMKTADFVLVCTDGSVVVHRTLLAAASPFLKMILEEAPDALSFIVPDVKLATMKQVLSIFYTGQVCSSAIADFEDIKDAIEILGVKIEAESWTVENVHLRTAATVKPAPVLIPKPTITTTIAPAPERSTTVTTKLPILSPRPDLKSPTVTVKIATNENDEVKIIEPSSASASASVSPDSSSPPKRRKIVNPGPRTTQQSIHHFQQQQYQNLVNILPKNLSTQTGTPTATTGQIPMPMPMPVPMIVAQSASDVIQSMLQSGQLSLGPAFANGILGQQLYQQSTSQGQAQAQMHPQFMATSSSGAQTNFINTNQGIVPMQFGFYQQGQGQAHPGQTIQQQQQQMIFQTGQMGAGIQNQFQNPGFAARMPSGSGNVGQYKILQPNLTEADAKEEEDEEQEPLYLITEDGEEMQVLGSWDVGDVATIEQVVEIGGEEEEEEEINEFTMSTEEILSNRVVSSKKDHCYTTFEPKETSKQRRVRLRKEAKAQAQAQVKENVETEEETELKILGN